MNILVVEDNQVTAHLIRGMLEKIKHTVTIAVNGREAWQKLQQEEFDVVLSDWMMPEMDGLELCQKIRESQSANYIYIILLTAKEQRADRLLALQTGADDFLIKPPDLSELQARLNVAQRILSGQKDLRMQSAQLAEALSSLEIANRRVTQELLTSNRLNMLLEQQRQELARANKLLTEMAATDGLTGLANRRRLNEALDEKLAFAKRHAEPLSTIMLDVDHFKDFNDKFGHVAGDEVLREVARLLLNQVRGDDLVARYGGEEFMLVLPSTNDYGAKQMAERVRRVIEEHRWVYRPITVSLGIATMDTTPLDKNTLITYCDQALYEAKQNGRNCVRQYFAVTQ